MLPPIIAWLEDYGFVSDELIHQTLGKMNAPRLNRLRSELNDILDRSLAQSMELPRLDSDFSFVASSSMRGERCCIHPDCRMKKADQLFTFSSLYADRLHLPLDTGYRNDSPHLLEGSIRMLHFHRPLIDAGIVVPSQGGLHLCKQHREEFFDDSSGLQSIADKLAEKHRSEFSAFVYPFPGRGKQRLRIRLEGPPSLLDGTTFFDLDPSSSLYHEYEDISELSKDEILRSGVLDHVFFPSMKDFFLQNGNSGRYGEAAYLSDLPSEAEFFAAARSNSELETWRMSVLKCLSHSVPTFFDLPMERLLDLRQSEEDAFRNYRNAVTKAVRSAPTGADPREQARTIWREQIRPEVEKLQSKANIIRRSTKKTVATRVIPAGMLIGIGLFGSHLSPELAHAIEVIAGCSMVRDLFPNRKGSVSDQLGSEDYYFLLQAGK